MPRDGKLLYTDEEIEKMLKLLTFNLGVKKSLHVIHRELVETTIEKNK
jgi:hypothetical protein